MKQESARGFYLSMLNALSGLRDDLDANECPEEAKELLGKLIEVCEGDFAMKF